MAGKAIGASDLYETINELYRRAARRMSAASLPRDDDAGFVPLPPLKQEKPREPPPLPLQALRTVPKDPLRG